MNEEFKRWLDDATFEDLMVYVDTKRTNVDVFTTVGEGEVITCGVRLRPYKNQPRDGSMVLASGQSFKGALSVAIQKAASGRWEQLDWAKRPWQTARSSDW